MYRIDSCPCCGNRALSTWPAMLSPFISEYATDGTISVVDFAHCSTCEFKFFLDRYDNSEVAILYSNYRGDKYFKVRNRHEFYYTRAVNEALGEEEIRLRQSHLIHLLNKHDIATRIVSVLDWGGDRGQFIPETIPRRNVYEISDVTPVPGVTRFDNEQDVMAGSFDMVMLCHVLEHCSDPGEMVRLLTGLNSEFYYIEVPLEPFRIMRIMPYSWYRKYVTWISRWGFAWVLVDLFTTFCRIKLGLIPPFAVLKEHEHINFFSKNSLLRLLVSNSLFPIEIGCRSYHSASGGQVLFCLAQKK